MTEALPLGNGSLGGMFFGLTETERVQFNHNTLWTGDEHDPGMYQAFGDIFIQLGHQQATDYRRELDIDKSAQKISYRANGVRYERTAFASHPAKVMVYHFSADKPGAHSGRIWLADTREAKISGEGNRLTLSGRLGKDGMEYEAQLLVLNSGGKIRIENKSLDVGDNPLSDVPDRKDLKLPGTYLVFEGCSTLTLVLAADTNYAPDRSKKWRTENPRAAVSQRLNNITSKSLSALFNAHLEDYRSLFHRFKLELGTTAPERAAKPTNERLLDYTKKQSIDPDLEELFAQYGRYLLISCSRPGGMPANLQGLWNHSNNPPWRSDYHSNINVQMNYWLAEPTNLAELHRPFMDYVSSQIPVYREHSRKQYGDVRGWTVRTENGVYGAGAFLWNPPGSAWYAQHYWEHYAFSQDKRYLAEVAYPMMKEVCEFWQDRLIARPDGTLVTPVGWSPEHGPEEEAISYDLQIVHDLFTNTIQAADALGIDKAFRDNIATLREKLLKPKIGKWGQLQEWETDRDDPKNTHRHVSHLFGLHPGRQITATGTPELFAAGKVTLNARGDGGTGWSRAWKINFWARFLDGDRSYRLLRNLLTYANTVGEHRQDGAGVYPNLFDTHSPFQIDGNFGATSGIAEMLVQSQSGEIVLLPALPSAWPTGSVSGMRARGGFTVNLQWKDGKLEGVALHSTAGTTATLRYQDLTTTMTLKPGQSVRLDAALKPL
jgi:alpha-L-fucosidase 2